MGIYAMMSGNTVGNIIVADDKEITEQALGCILIEITPDNPAGIGWTLGENSWIAPTEITEEMATDNGS